MTLDFIFSHLCVSINLNDEFDRPEKGSAAVHCSKTEITIGGFFVSDIIAYFFYTVFEKI